KTQRERRAAQHAAGGEAQVGVAQHDHAEERAEADERASEDAQHGEGEEWRYGLLHAGTLHPLGDLPRRIGVVRAVGAHRRSIEATGRRALTCTNAVVASAHDTLLKNA